MQLGLHHQNNQVQGQETLFDLLGAEAAATLELQVELPATPEFHPRQRLKLEKEALGFYISGHPLDRYQSEVGSLAVSTHDLREGEYEDGAEVLVAGMVGAMTVRMSRNAEKLAILRLEDLRGSIEVMVFPKLYAEVQGLLREEEPLLIRARVNVREEEINLHANQVLSLSRYRAEQARRLTVRLDAAFPEAHLPRLVGVLSQSSGECAVRFRVATAEGSQVLLEAGLTVAPTDRLLEELEQLLGPLALQFDYPREAEGRLAGRGGGHGNGNGHGNGHGHGTGRGGPPAAGQAPRGEGAYPSRDSA